MNRTIAPPTEDIKTFHIIEAQKAVLSNGVAVYHLNTGTEEVLKLDFYFAAGTKFQQQKTQAALTNQLLTEGTLKHTSAQISNALDFYGAYVQTRCSADEACLTLFCLKKHLANCLPFVLEILTDAAYPKNDFETIRKNNIQKLSVNEKKNSYLARRYFYATIFGEDHPYGSYVLKQDYEAISRENLADFFKQNYPNKLKYVLVSGKVDSAVLKNIDGVFGSTTNPKPEIKNPPIANNHQPITNNFFYENPASVQSAIRVGRLLFNRAHKDFRELQLLNLILGGYFGSRLMKNIREDKGLTYGIYSVLESYEDAGCFYIDTEINNELRALGLKEIYFELTRLREELIADDELNTAKNYMLGSFLRSIDGPFSLMDRFKILLDFGFDYTYYQNFPSIIKNTSSQRLCELANQYLQQQNLVEVVVGKQ